MRDKTTTIATYISDKKINGAPVLKIAIKKPAVMGPNNLPMLKVTEFKLMAFATRSSGTILIDKAVNTGPCIAQKVVSMKEKTASNP